MHNTLKLAEILLEKPYIIAIIGIATILITIIIIKISNKRKDKNK